MRLEDFDRERDSRIGSIQPDSIFLQAAAARLRTPDLLYFSNQVCCDAGRGELRAMFRELLSATSMLAVIVALGGNASACSPGGTITGPGSFTAFENFGTLDCVTITNNATVNGGVSNASTGVIGPPSSPAPGSLSINGSTINGSVQNSGHIFAGGGTPAGISVTGGSVITNGIINNSTGTIGVNTNGGSAFGIQVSQTSSFAGGITNNGVITATNSSGGAAGLSIGGGGGQLAPSSNQSSLNTPTTGTTGGVTKFSGTGRHHH